MIRVINWQSYQSYKDRKPPWIRLHKSLLDDFEFQSMSAEARALLPMLWLLASEDEDPQSGLIRDSYEKITFRLRMSYENVTESLREIERAGFIETKQPCNESVTKSLRNRNQTVTPETETETETDNKHNLVTESLQNRNQTVTDSLQNKKEPALDKSPPPLYDEWLKFMEAYPQTSNASRITEVRDYPHWEKIVKSGEVTPEQLLDAVKAYAKSPDVKKGYVKNCNRWFADGHWKNFLESNRKRKTSNQAGKNQEVLDNGTVLPPGISKQEWEERQRILDGHKKKQKERAGQAGTSDGP